MQILGSFPVPDTAYEVVLLVTPNYCVDADTLEIHCQSPCGRFWVKTNIAMPATVQFSDLSSATLPLTYEWGFGDGNAGVQASPAHTYTSVDSFSSR